MMNSSVASSYTLSFDFVFFPVNNSTIFSVSEANFNFQYIAQHTSDMQRVLSSYVLDCNRLSMMEIIHANSVVEKRSFRLACKLVSREKEHSVCVFLW